MPGNLAARDAFTAKRALRIVAFLLAGLACGLPAGWFVGRAMKASRLQNLPWADDMAMAIAVGLTGMGVIIAAMAVTRQGQALLLNPLDPDFDRPARPEQRRFFGLQAAVVILAGLMLAAPVVFELLTKGGVQGLGAPMLIGVILAFVLQTGLNVRVWMQSDEVLRRVIAESGAASFWLFQGVFFLWACAEKMKLVPSVSSWQTVTLLMGLYLVTSTVVAYRRGLS